MPISMTDELAIYELTKVRARLENAVKAVDNKRSWRQSEKAMTVAAYREEISAIDHAMMSLKERIKYRSQ